LLNAASIVIGDANGALAGAGQAISRAVSLRDQLPGESSICVDRQVNPTIVWMNKLKSPSNSITGPTVQAAVAITEHQAIPKNNT
jgi:hypothetical protein